MRRLAEHATAAPTRQSRGDRVVPPSKAEHVFALQRAAGNQAVGSILQRASLSSKRPTLERRALEAWRKWRRGLADVRELRKVADELIEKELGSKPVRRPGARRNGLAEIASRGGPQGRRARQVGSALADAEAQLDKRAGAVASVADDLIESELGGRPKTPQARENGLNTLRDRGGGVGQQAAGLQGELREVEEELATRRPNPRRPSKGERWRARQRARQQAEQAAEQEWFAKAEGTAAKGEETAGKTAGKAEGTAAKTVTKVEEAGAGGLGKAAVKAEEAVAEAAATPKLYKRVATNLGKLGVELLEGLVPDPLDALEVMYDFAGSYKEAWERIKRGNLTNGFAIGLAAYLVIPRWEWAKYYARTTVSRDVATQVLGAVGIAENAFNDGLVRGFLYGEKHSTAQANRLRQKAFDALVKAGRMPGHYEGNDVYTFGRDDVYSFAVALHPTAVSVLKEADRRRAARIESEKLREDMKRWSRVPIGADKY
jgi:hypothetical protein